mgnify:CR=1 FL=1
MTKQTKTDIAMNAFADLLTRDITKLITSGRHKEAISVGESFGLDKEYIEELINDYNKEIKNGTT